MPDYKVLSAEQIQSFLDNGYLVVKNCVDLNFAQRWIARGYERLGYDQNDPRTWVKDMIWMQNESEVAIREVAPRAWAALLDVVGGEERLGTPRIVTNPPVWLKEPFNFHRANPDDYSLVERATLRALGVDYLDFQPAAPREGVWWPMK